MKKLGLVFLASFFLWPSQALRAGMVIVPYKTASGHCCLYVFWTTFEWLLAFALSAPLNFACLCTRLAIVFHVFAFATCLFFAWPLATSHRLLCTFTARSARRALAFPAEKLRQMLSCDDLLFHNSQKRLEWFSVLASLTCEFFASAIAHVFAIKTDEQVSFVYFD